MHVYRIWEVDDDSVLPGDRVLCLAPPGEVGALAARCLARAGRDGRVVAIVRGEPWLSGDLPPEVEVRDADPGRPHGVRGPFDAVVATGSEPFLAGCSPFFVPVRDALRPGGRLYAELPAYGFSPVLQACDPRAADWYLPNPAALRTALTELGLRSVEVSTEVTVRRYATLAELVADRVRPFPLAFENESGRELLEELRNHLASAFAGSDPARGGAELALALRFVKLRAIR